MSPESESLTGRLYVRKPPDSIAILSTATKIIKYQERTSVDQRPNLGSEHVVR